MSNIVNLSRGLFVASPLFGVRLSLGGTALDGGSSVRASQRKPSGTWRSALAVLAVAGIATAGCGLLPQTGVAVHPLPGLPAPATQQISTIPVQTGTVTASVQVAGLVEPRQSALLYFTLGGGGQIATLNMTNDALVKKGQVLATLDAGNLPFEINQQNLTIERDQLHINDLESSLQLQPPTSAQNAANFNFALQQARIQLNQDQLHLMQLQLQLARYQITAPFSGEITNVNVHLGQYVGAYQTLAQIQDTSAVRFVAKLNPTVVPEISTGQPVEFSLAAHPQTKYTTTVNSVQVPTPADVAIAKANHGFGGLTQPQVTLNRPAGYVLTPNDIGGAFTAIITVAQANNVLYLPNSGGIITSFEGLNSVNLDVQGQIVQRLVTLGLQGDTSIQITGGLQAGDQVVVP